MLKSGNKPTPQTTTTTKPPLQDMEFKQWCDAIEAGKDPKKLALSKQFTLSAEQKEIIPLLIKINSKSPDGIMKATDFASLWDLKLKGAGFCLGVLDTLK